MNKYRNLLTDSSLRIVLTYRELIDAILNEAVTHIYIKESMLIEAPVYINRSVSIEGSLGTLLFAESTLSSCFVVQADRVSISNLKFQNFTNAINVSSGEDLSIQNVSAVTGFAITGTLNNLRTADFLSGHLESPEVKTYTLLVNSPFQIELLSITCDASAGTGECYIASDGVDIAGPISLSTTEVTTSLLGEVVNIGENLELRVSSVTSLENLIFTLTFLKVG